MKLTPQNFFTSTNFRCTDRVSDSVSDMISDWVLVIGKVIALRMIELTTMTTGRPSYSNSTIVPSEPHLIAMAGFELDFATFR
jgi:hypothetical protein